MPELLVASKQDLCGIFKNEKPEIENMKKILEALTREEKKKFELSGYLNEIFQNPLEILSGETHESENELALTAD